MQIGISTACFYPLPVEQALARLCAQKAPKAEIFFNTESEFSDEFCDNLLQTAAQSGTEIVSIHPYTSLMEGMFFFSPYARRLEDGLRQYETYFRQAARLGAKYLSFHGERDMGQVDTEADWQRKCEGYRRLCALGEKYGVRVTQENVAWCRAGKLEFIERLRRDVPELLYVLDLKQAHRAGQSWQQVLNVIDGNLANIHLNDFDEKGGCLMPFRDGLMDYQDFFSTLQYIDYNGDALLEVYRSNFDADDELGQAIEQLQAMIPE